ncbi:hypothetical protein GT020_15105 [Glutamicibacter soli]|uniref:SD-repeat containing protein B domain-containing protein n=1 Tax=Glutamicibacter soli TaxID=453836 RepID=A0A6L9G6J4_9MICC|nr:hypothetical protein [Glutamicibacter soli]
MKKRLKPLLAGLLSFTLGVGMLGVAPAMATTNSAKQDVEATPTVATSPVTESSDNESPEPTATVQESTASEKIEESPKSSVEETPAESSKPAAAPEVQETAPAKNEPKKSDAREGVAPALTDKGMLLEKSVQGTTKPKPGESVVYEIKVGCSSNTNPCNDAFFVDALPEPLVLESVAFQGFVAPVTQEISDDKKHIKLIFNETSVDRPGQKGLNAGADYTILLTAKLPENTPPEYKDVELINEAELTSTNGTITDKAPAVTPDIDWAPKAEITKSWAADSLLQNSNGENTLTLGGIKNASKSGAVALKITEPSGESKPFDAVAFTGFGEIVYPEGADELEVTYFVDGVPHKATTGTANPNAPPAFPTDFDLSTIDGFEFTFTSSDSAGNVGGIVANGNAGSIELNTKLRDSEATENVTVNNETTIVAELPNNVLSDPKTAKDSFVVEATKYSVNTTKSFTKDEVVAGEAGQIGNGRNTTGVKLGITNTSNNPLTSLTLKEPADETASPFGHGIDFAQFTAGTWPQGATSGVIKINGAEYELTDQNGQIEFPDNMPTGSGVKSFEVVFNGDFKPGSGYTIDFDVVGITAKDDLYSNTVRGNGTYPGGTTPVEDDATDTLLVVDPKQKNKSFKDFSPSRIEGIPGDKTSANLKSRVDSTGTNVDVREIVQTDDFSSMIAQGFKATHISVPQTQGATSVLVKYQDAAGNWHTLATSDGSAIPATEVPAGAKAVQVTYERKTGSFPSDRDVQAKLDFELQEVIGDDPGKKEISNVLGVNNGENFTGTADVDKAIQLSSSKSWNSNSIVQKPSNMFPTTTLKLNATNTSTYGVDKLAIVDPKAGEANPFDYLNMTGFSATVTDQNVKSLAYLKLIKADGTTIDFTDESALKPQLAAGTLWEEFVGFEFGLSKTADMMVPRDVRFDIAVPTILREKHRVTGLVIDQALENLSPTRDGTGYVLPNVAHATIERGPENAQTSPKAPLEITTDNSVVLNSELTKTLNPSSNVDFFDKATGNPKHVKVQLTVDTKKHKADYVQITDSDPTFWNAFDFAGWDPTPSSRVSDVTIEYLTGASFISSKDDGKLVSEGGAWTPTKPANAEVQGVRVTFKGKDYAELEHLANTITFNAMPRYTLRSGDVIALDKDAKNPGEAAALTVENTASAEVSRLDKKHDPKDATDSIVFNPGETGASVDKTSDVNGGLIVPGNVVNYTFTATNNGTDAIIDPVITDQLPFDAATGEPNLILEPEWESAVKYGFKPNFSQAPEETKMPTDRDKIVAVQDGTKVTFSFPKGTKLYPGETYTITLPTTIRGGLKAGTDLTNKVVFGNAQNSEMDDGNAQVRMMEGQAYASQKLVREVLQPGQTDRTGVHNVLNPDASDKCYEFGEGFYRYPCVVETKPGGISEWNLSVTNTGNVDTQHLEILDIFPFPGDTGVTVSQKDTPRGSQWTPLLLDITTPNLPEGATAKVSYMIGDPATCKPNGTNPEDPWDGCETDWVDVRPANAKDIRGIKVIFDFEKVPLQPNESVSLSFTMQSATEMPEGADALAPAWNSFGYSARAKVSGVDKYRSQEPIKTGITFQPPTVPLEKVRVGNYVWVDTNRDGIQDDNEKGIKDVALTIVGPGGNPVTDVYGNPVGPVWTDANGEYYFENLPVLEEGSYTVKIDKEASKEPLAPYIPTIVGEGNRDHDSSLWEASSEGLTKDGEEDLTLDFGFVVPKVSVGDYVWVDTNRNGLQDDNEPGIEGVVLELRGPDGKPVVDVFGKPVDSMTTDKNGNYLFPDLPALKGDEKYTVVINKEKSAEALDGYQPTKETAGNREKDSSTWEATTDNEAVDLTKDGANDPTLDFGFIKPSVSVGDYVWVDTDRDGLQDEGEKGIKNVVLTIVGPDGQPVTDVYGTPVGPVSTDENGMYLFPNLPVLGENESYTVSIDKEASKEPLAPYVPTIETANNRENDSSTDFALSEGLTTDGEHDPTLDFGFVLPKVTVGDYVWVDEDRDGLQDADEQGIKDVVLTIVGPDGKPVTDVFGKPVGPTKTDADGKYIFEYLPVLKEGESYTVTIDREASKEPLAPYVPTIETDDNRDNDSSIWTATSKGLTEDGNEDLTLDFGFVVPRVSVGDYVWVDSNRDGIQDAGEPGIEGVTLELIGPDGKPVTDIKGNPVLPTKTDANGAYTFENLPVLKEGESYTVKIDREASKEPLAPYVPTIVTDGDRENDSSKWEASSQGLTKNEDRDPTLDFGFVLPKVTVGDYVWVDTNRDGKQDDGELGIKDVVLTIVGPDGEPVTDVFGNPVDPVTTDENGKYLFPNLPVLGENESYTVTIDKDASEEALAPYIPTIETDGDRGDDSSTWVATTEGLTEDGNEDLTLDFGFVLPKVTVGDYVWVDTNRDGIQDEGEKGIKDVVLTIVGPNGEPVTDVYGTPVGPVSTDENGKYLFPNLPVLGENESYTVTIDKEASEEALAPYIPTIETDGDRDQDSSTWEAKTEGLTKDEDEDLTLDFGFVLPKVTVGDYVWVDENRDGIQNEGEKGIKDVVLTIVGPDGLPVTDVFGNPVGPVTTDENGKYIFENLPVLKDGDSYTVKIDREASKEPLAPYVPTIVTDDNRENDSSVWEATTEGLTKDGDEDLTLDFGFIVPKVSVGDYVWVDTNRDGKQDDGEPGIKDVVLTIVGPDGEPVTDIYGEPVGPVATDENGKYTFENLPVLKDGESYTVKIDKESSEEALAPYIPTRENEGDRSEDSSTWEAKSEGLTENDQRDGTLDFGFVKPKVSVGDYVWFDEDADGIQDDDENGIKDVVLIVVGPDGEPVTDVNGNPVGLVTTDENGKYTFENLPVLKDGESYTVKIDKEASKDALKDYAPTPENRGDRDKDSSTWEAKSEGLTKDGDRDPTLDFGFQKPLPWTPIEPTTPTEPTDPSEPSKPTEPTCPAPSESAKPSDPSEPGESSDPSEPAGPSDCPEPSEPADSTDSTADSQKPSASEDPKDEEKDDLASTGFTALSVLVAGLLLAAAGVMITRRNRGRHS